MDSLLEGAQQLVVDHYAEIEECPFDVHRGASMPGGFSPTLDWSDDDESGGGQWSVPGYSPRLFGGSVQSFLGNLRGIAVGATS